MRSLTKGEIDRAGEVLRARALRGQSVKTLALDPELSDALSVVSRFRESHQPELASVTAGLRHHAVKSAAGEAYSVGQRLKRMDTIWDKLLRQPKMKLARMQDIGGCRAVLGNQAAIDVLIDRLLNQPSGAWSPAKPDNPVTDYVVGPPGPKVDGYRAKHLVLFREAHGLGSPVRIEVQFRTRLQDAWAQLVEDLDRALNIGLKQGRAEANDVAAIAAAAEHVARYEQGNIDWNGMNRAVNEVLSAQFNVRIAND